MTTAELLRSQVSIAGVPWPMHKVVALVAGLITLLVIGTATASAATAVLTAAGIGTAVWLALGPRHRSPR